MPQENVRAAGRRSAPSLELTDRDRSLLSIFGDVRFVRSSQLERLTVPLLFPSTHAFSLRVNKLKRAGFLELPAKALNPAYTTRKRDAHRPENIYALSSSGAAEIGLPGDLSRNNKRLSGNDPFSHALLISEVYTLLQLGSRSGAYTLTSWVPENGFREQVDVTWEGARHTLPVCPDAVFVLEKDGKEREFFLEVDCATEPLTRSNFGTSSYLKKVVAYQEFWKRESRAEPGIAFVVLTVAETEARTTSLKQTAREADPRGRGLNLFYFTLIESWDLERPQAFSCEPIWATPSGERRRLLGS